MKSPPNAGKIFAANDDEARLGNLCLLSIRGKNPPNVEKQDDRARKREEKKMRRFYNVCEQEGAQDVMQQIKRGTERQSKHSK
jgi:hypothetical protein